MNPPSTAYLLAALAHVEGRGWVLCGFHVFSEPQPTQQGPIPRVFAEVASARGSFYGDAKEEALAHDVRVSLPYLWPAVAHLFAPDPRIGTTVVAGRPTK